MSFSPPFKAVFEPGDFVYGDQYDRRFFLYSGIVDPIHYKKEFDLIKLTDKKPVAIFDERTQPGRMQGLLSIWAPPVEAEFTGLRMNMRACPKTKSNKIDEESYDLSFRTAT